MRGAHCTLLPCLPSPSLNDQSGTFWLRGGHTQVRPPWPSVAMPVPCKIIQTVTHIWSTPVPFPVPYPGSFSAACSVAPHRLFSSVTSGVDSRSPRRRASACFHTWFAASLHRHHRSPQYDSMPPDDRLSHRQPLLQKHMSFTYNSLHSRANYNI